MKRFRLSSNRTREIVYTTLAGVSGCLVALGFAHGIDLLHNWIWVPLSHAGWKAFAGVGLLVLCSVGLITGWMVGKIAPEAAGSGIPQLKVSYWRDMARIRTRLIIVKFFAGILSVGGGMSMGREGPTVQLAGGVASIIGQKLGVAGFQLRAMTACGAAAGLAAAFNTPIASVTFVLEEVLENLNSRLVGRILLASFASVFVLYLLAGESPSLALPRSLHFDWLIYLLVIPASACATLTGAAFQQAALSWRRHIRTKASVPVIIRPMIGALITWGAATAAFFWTGHIGVLGLGYGDLNTCLTGSIALSTLFILLVGKWIATTASYAWGGCGGIFAPTLFIGAFSGACFAALMAQIIPLPADAVPILAVVGMSACLGSVVRAPATSILIVFEMTHDFAIVPPLMLGALISQMLSRKLCAENFYSQVILDDGIDLSPHKSVQDFSEWKKRRIASFATFPVRTLPSDDARQARLILSETPFNAYPVYAPASGLAGVIARSQVPADDSAPHEWPLVKATTIPIDATLDQVEASLVEASLGLVIVVDANKVPLGVFTLHDLLRCQLSLMENV